MCIDFGVETNDNDPKFEVGDHVGMSKYINIFAKDYTQFRLKKILWLKKVVSFVIRKSFVSRKNTVLWRYVLEDLNREEIFTIYNEKEFQKRNKTKLRVEKVIKRRGDKLYVKWKGYDTLFYTWIDKKGIII